MKRLAIASLVAAALTATIDCGPPAAAAHPPTYRHAVKMAEDYGQAVFPDLVGGPVNDITGRCGRTYPHGRRCYVTATVNSTGFCFASVRVYHRHHRLWLRDARGAACIQ